MNWTAWAQQAKLAGLDFLYPANCLWCGRFLGAATGLHSGICAECESAIAPPVRYRCRRCSAPVGPNLNTEQGCVVCKRDPMHYQQVVSLGAYEEELRRACLRCKQPGQRILTSELTRVLCRRDREILTDWNVDVVMPVPHHWRDRWGTDPAADAVAEALGRILKRPVERRILCKVRRTSKQQDLSASARRDNLRGAFRMASYLPEGTRVLLADDILTTGTTAQRCTRTLLQAGAACVFVAVLARGTGS